jgi:hypothetical protein
MDENTLETSGGEATGSQAASSETDEASSHSRLNWERYAPQPTVLTLQDLIDLPRQILPEPTYRHLKNAGIEAWLAITTFMDGLSDTVNGLSRSEADGETKARRRINVE